MSNERGETLVTPATGLFRMDGGVRGLTYARSPQSKRRRSGIGIHVRNDAGEWLRTQLSVERRDFYGVFVEAARHVAGHGGLRPERPGSPDDASGPLSGRHRQRPDET